MITANWIRHTAIQIGSIYTATLDMDYTIDSTTTDATAATATIKIYNLAPQTIAKIAAGDRVTLEGGYQADHGIIYLGRVATVTQGRDGADTYAEITCTDYTWPASMRTRSYPKGTRIGDMLRTLYADAALPIGPIIADLGATTTDAYTTDPNGKTTLDQLISMINGDPDVIAASISVHHAIIGGAACVVASNQTTTDTHIISRKTGLISTSPETDDGIDMTVTTLLNWRIQIDAAVELTTLGHGSGTYKVASYRHQAEGDRYQTIIKLTAL